MGRVVLENLVKTFPAAGRQAAFSAVKGIDLEIHDGEFMVLVGPSGCGKSTTLRMIAGLEEITSGTIAIDGRVVNHVLPKDRDIAMVFQNYALYPHMSVYDNLAFGLRLRKVAEPEIEQRVREAAQLLGLDLLLERKPKALSGGQRQRVAVGRAIIRQPKVFLFDEPLSNLDATMRVAMRTEISKLHSRLRATMIYVTHDQTEAMTMGDRICVMNEGRIVQVDPPLTLYDQPQNQFAAGFIGSPPMNFFRGQLGVEQGRVLFRGEAAGWEIALPTAAATALSDRSGQPVVLGVRPEDIALAHEPWPQQTFAANIELVEPTGAETFVHLRTGPTLCIARVPGFPAARPGDAIHVRPGLDRARFFDATTQQAIPWGAPRS